MSAFSYAISRLFFHVTLSLRHWYYDSFFLYVHFGVGLFRRMDRHLAFVLTLRHFFEPLYQDYSVIGYVFGFVFRTLRLMLGAAIYLVLIPPFIALFIAWALIPVWVVFHIIVP
jgi:hypothetical protein